MDAAQAIVETAPPPLPRFLLGRSTAWLLLLIVGSLAFAWPVFRLSHLWAPWLLFPCAVGLLWGSIAGRLATALRLKHRPTIYVGAVTSGLFVAIGTHWYEYRADLNAPRSAQLDTLLNAFPDMADRPNVTAPRGFGDFLSRQAKIGRRMPFGWTANGPWAWVTWCLDALLLAGFAMLAGQVATDRPYCGSCGSYFQSVREERVDSIRHQHCNKQFGLDWPQVIDGYAKYCRLVCHCPNGSELLTVGVNHHLRTAPRFAQNWLSTEDCKRVFQALDQSE